MNRETVLAEGRGRIEKKESGGFLCPTDILPHRMFRTEIL